MTDILIVKSNGSKEVFKKNKLIRSLKKSGASEEEVLKTVEFVLKNLKSEMTTNEIYALAFKNLNSQKERNPNAIRYSLKNSLMELGPTGFPFEKFVARVFNELGYKTSTGVMVEGHCIEHEVDVLAYNDTEVICIEAKFHNKSHLRSDAKVALYVKSRFDDLIGEKIKMRDEYKHITRGILVTNTNFTDTAHNYVTCVGTYELMSWNKPEEKNLLSYIEKFKLYPIGVVPELSQKEIDVLVEKHILTCSDLAANPEILHDMGMKKSKQILILNTIEEICNC